jgi:hypothetical protein
VAPGWTLVPSVGAASSWDNNVALTSPQRGELKDQVTTAFSSLSTQYRGRRGDFLLEYRGMYDFYRRYTEFNAPDHRVRLNAQRRFTRTVTGFVRNAFSLTPTTEVPFSDTGLLTLNRRTTSTNDFAAGLDLTPWRRTMITTAYGNQWIDLARDQDVQPLLRGGYLHRGDVTLRRQIWPRAALGAAYSTQFATVSGGMESFEIQRAEALLDVALGPTLTFSGRGGWAWQQAGFTGSQNAPSFAAELRYQGERTRMSIGYERTYLASFGFGGTVQNRSFQATLDAPINQRFDVGARATWRENDPLFATTLNLQGLIVQGTAGVNFVSWLRLETYVASSWQDTQVAGGRIDRTRAGVRLLTLYPMRLQ